MSQTGRDTFLSWADFFAAERRSHSQSLPGRRASACALPLFLLFFCLTVPGKPGTVEGFSENDLEKVVALLERGRFREAEARLQKGLKADPRSVVAHRFLGLIYQREEKFFRAEQLLEKAVQLSQHKDLQSLFALCQTKFALKKVREALDLAGRLGALAENNSQLRYMLGRLLRENSLPQQATRELEIARVLAPQDVAITTELIGAFLDTKNSRQAEALLQPLLNSESFEDLLRAGSRLGETKQMAASVRVFKRAAQLRPGSYDAQFNLAFAYYRQDDFPKALATLHQIDRASQSEAQPDYHYLRAKIELALGNTQVAGEHFLYVLKRQPDNESLCVEAGLLFYKHENFRKALEIFESCTRALTDSAVVDTGLALTYFRLGKYKEAIAWFKNVLSLRPEADAAREGLAFLLYISGNMAEARQILEQRLSGKNVDFYIYYLHALVLQRLDARANRAKVLQSVEEALRRNPQFAPAYFQRGRVWAEQGDIDRALADFEMCTDLDPDYAAPYYPMAQIYFKLGKKREADQARLRFAALAHEQEEREQKRELENRIFQSIQ